MGLIKCPLKSLCLLHGINGLLCPITYDFMAERENTAPGRCRHEHLKLKLLLLSAATLGFKGSVIKVNVEFLNY